MFKSSVIGRLIVSMASVFAGLFCYAADALVVSGNMKIDEDCTVGQIVFMGAYELTGTGRITIEDGGGIAVRAGAASIANPVTFDGASEQKISLVADSSLSQTGVWSGAAPINVQGANKTTSVLHLYGANDFTGEFKSIGPCTIHAYTGTAFGTADGKSSWECGGANGTIVYFYSGTVAENISVSHKSYDHSVRVAKNSIVTFTGTVSLGATGYIQVNVNATVVIKGSLNGGSYFCPFIDGNAVLRFDEGCSLNCVCLNPSGYGTIELASANSGLDTYNAYNIGGSVTIKMLRENVINSTVQRGGTFNKSSVWDLNGYSQNGGLCRGGEATATVKSDTPATLTLLTAADPVTNPNAFVGEVSLSKSGEGELTLTSSRNTSTGTLSALSGGVTLDAGATWCGDVFVAEGATMTITGDNSIRNVTIETGGKLVIDGAISVEKVTLGGIEQNRGRSFNATNASGFIEGTGSLISYGDKLVISEDTVLDDDVYVSAIEFTGGYRLSGNGKVHLLSGGISVATGTVTIENDIDFCGAATTELSVGANGILVQTGVWSGSSPLKFVGVGSSSSAHRFELRGANTFTGNVTMNAARIDTYNGLAFGSVDGTTTISTIGGANGSRIYFHGGDYYENFSVGSGVTYSGWWQPVIIAEGMNKFYGTCNFGVPHYQNTQAGATAIHYKNLAGNGYYCANTSNGGVIVLAEGFNMSMEVFNPGGNGSRDGGYIELRAPISKKYQLSGAHIEAMGENVFNCAKTEGCLTAKAFINMNGYDQQGGGFFSEGKLDGAIYSETPATWTSIINKDVSVPYTFEGQASLRKEGNATLTLTGASTSTGTITIQAGGVKLADGASWAGTIDVNSFCVLETSGNRTVGTINLADGAKLRVEGRLLVTTLVVNGETMPTGRSYSLATGSDFIEGTGVLVTDGNEDITLTWTGEGADDGIATAANWGLEQLPELNSGFASAIFASSGTRAMVDRFVNFSGISFTASAFTLDATASDVFVALGSGGITLDSGSADAVYEIATPVEFREKTSIVGDGRLDFLVGGKWFSPITVTNANIKLSGEHSFAKSLSFRAMNNLNAEGRLWVSNAVVRATDSNVEFIFQQGDRYYPFEAEPDTTNRVEVAIRGSNATRLRFAENSKTTFAGGGNWGSYCVIYFDENSTAIIEGTSMRAMNIQAVSSPHVGGKIVNGGQMIFRVPGNIIYDANYGSVVTVSENITMKFEVPDVFSVDDLTTLDVRRNGVIDLCGCDQHVGPMRPGTAGGVIRSEEPATLYVDQKVSQKNGDTGSSILDTIVCTTTFAGEVSLNKKGSLELDLSAASTSAGSLTVVAGTLAFAEDGFWAGHDIAVEGGVLKLDRRNRISRNADVTITNGKVDIADGVVQIVAGGMIGDVQMLKGVSYGSSESSADVKDDIHFSGKGVLRLPGGGFCFSIK